MIENESSKRLSRSQASWLEAHTSEWVSAGLIDADARARILRSYEVESAERHGLLALVLLGALMFGIGVLLLIGYNWARIPVNGKIAIIMSSVALAFAASAVAFARRHPVSGETLALIGVLLFGNAIWLIAQVLHMQGHFSDAFLWWAVGALACALLVQSKGVGAGAAILVGVWVTAAGFTVDRPLVSFLVVWAATVFVAYQQRSTVMLKIAALAAVAWVSMVSDRVQPASVSCGAAALAGCAFCAIGLWHRASNPMRRAWLTTGLAVLLLVFIPLLMTDMHHGAEVRNVTWRSLTVTVPLLLVAVSPVLRWLRPDRAGADSATAGPQLADITTLLTAVGVASWMGLTAAGFAGSPMWTRSATVGFSVLALAMSVSLIRKALRTDTPADLAFGVFFGLAFLLVRWASLIDSMLWSGLMLLVASAGFFAIARLWRDRERRPAMAGSTS